MAEAGRRGVTFCRALSFIVTLVTPGSVTPCVFWEVDDADVSFPRQGIIKSLLETHSASCTSVMTIMRPEG